MNFVCFGGFLLPVFSAVQKNALHRISMLIRLGAIEKRNRTAESRFFGLSLGRSDATRYFMHAAPSLRLPISQAALQDTVHVPTKPRSRLSPSSAVHLASLASRSYFLHQRSCKGPPRQKNTCLRISTFIELRHGRDLRRRREWSWSGVAVHAALGKLPKVEEVLRHSSGCIWCSCTLELRTGNHVASASTIRALPPARRLRQRATKPLHHVV